MKRLFFLVVFFGAISVEALHLQLLEDYAYYSMQQNEEANRNRLWMFNGQTYQQNDSGQWILAGYKLPGNFQAWLEDLSVRGVCPKEHKGVYLDISCYDCGIWYCKGILYNGQRCPYHIDVQFPRGMPQSS